MNLLSGKEGDWLVSIGHRAALTMEGIFNRACIGRSVVVLNG